ncbi:MAG: peptidase M17, partial [Planctomycetales bacterium]|nr:peptidase M17 [Planctomycetales bacterium]
MKVVTGSGSIAKQDISALVVGIFEGEQLSGSATQLGTAAVEMFQRLLTREELSTKVGKASLLHEVPGVTAPSVLVVGCGERSAWDAAAAFRCAGAATKRLATCARQSVAIDLGESTDGIGSALVAGAMNGCVGQDLFRSEKSLHAIEQLSCWSLSEQALKRGVCLGEAMLLTRKLVNLPANYMYPEAFTQQAAEVSVASGLELEVWDELRLRRERCGAMLAVSAGSARPPRLLVMRYAGKKKQAPIALVGKGVTFDSGGLSIKPSEGMLTMKCDMPGA